MEIGDIMTVDVQTTSPEANAAEAVEKMARFHVGALPVCSDSHLVGIVTDRDILIRCVAEGRTLGRTPVGDVMTAGPMHTVGPRDSVHRAVQILGNHRIRRVPVVEGGHVLGIVSVADIARRLPDNLMIAEMIARAVRRPAHGRDEESQTAAAQG